jgi:uncharacterized SAM-binding protein YcdF (DUF218 family)
MTYDAVIILGFDVRPDGTLPEEGASRVRTGIQLYKEVGAKQLVMSGNVAHIHSYTPLKSEAQAMADYAVLQGFPPAKILIENKSKSTYENAIYTKKIVEANCWESIVVVTSQFHAQRAEYLFRKVYGDNYRIGFAVAHNCLSDAERSEINKLEAIKWAATLEHNKAKTLHFVDKTIQARITTPSG